jgi:hypothetical protein
MFLPQTGTAFRFLVTQYYTEEMSKHLESLYQREFPSKKIKNTLPQTD